MPLLKKEEDDLKKLGRGTQKLNQIKRIRSERLNKVLGETLVDDQGNPASDEDKTKARKKFLKRLEKIDEKEIRAFVNIEGVGTNLVVSPDNDYTDEELAAIRIRISKNRSQYTKVAQETVEEILPTLKKLHPTATPKEIRALLKI
jgi:hypothetical protein